MSLFYASPRLGRLYFSFWKKLHISLNPDFSLGFNHSHIHYKTKKDNEVGRIKLNIKINKVKIAVFLTASVFPVSYDV